MDSRRWHGTSKPTPHKTKESTLHPSPRIRSKHNSMRQIPRDAEITLQRKNAMKPPLRTSLLEIVLKNLDHDTEIFES